MYRNMVCLLGFVVLAGCGTFSRDRENQPAARGEEISVKIDVSRAHVGGSRIEVTLFHEKSVTHGTAATAEGNKTRFSIPITPGVWVRVKRDDENLGYDVLSECLIDGEMVPVSGMPGDNFSVKVEELALEKYRVMGVFLSCRHTNEGDVGKTVSFDFAANLGDEITVFRETVTYNQ